MRRTVAWHQVPGLRRVACAPRLHPGYAFRRCPVARMERSGMQDRPPHAEAQASSIKASVLAWVAGSIFIVGGVFAAVAQPGDAEQTTPVRTSSGEVIGLRAAGGGRFLGIPYAAPPVGDLRWRPPQAPKPWSQPLRAIKFGPHCAQTQRGVFASPSSNEDCLTLNVFTPQTQPSGGAARPVMVWFHGGGLFSGESDDYDGSLLARDGDVVVVTLNYRVGVFGFLSHPALNTEGHAYANYGIMDQQAALRWVKANIRGFGGNPDNVTIFGQSGGGTAVMANLVSPQSAGLFHRAINQSGTRIAVTRPETFLKIGTELATAAGCADQSAACLRGLSVEQVLAKQTGVLRVVADFPSVDGTIITEPALQAFQAGRFNRVPILTGLVQDEQSFFMPELNSKKPLTSEELDRYIASFGAPHRESILASYKIASYPTPTMAEIAIAQGAKACTARMLNAAWSRYVPVYAYEFRDRTAPSYFEPPSYPMNAYHTAELQYLFPSFHGGQGTPHPLNAAQEALSREMVAYWTSFARDGVPAAKSVPPWPRYVSDTDLVRHLDLAPRQDVGGYGKANDCAMWDQVLSYR